MSLWKKDDWDESLEEARHNEEKHDERKIADYGASFTFSRKEIEAEK